MNPIDQARAHLKEPAPPQRMIGALMAAFLCAMSAMMLAGAMIFGQLG